MKKIQVQQFHYQLFYFSMIRYRFAIYQGNFQILVYNADGTPYLQNFVVANVIGADTDSSVMRGSGRYYLTINSAQPYEITVEEMP